MGIHSLCPRVVRHSGFEHETRKVHNLYAAQFAVHALFRQDDLFFKECIPLP